MSQLIVILGPAYPLRGGGTATFNERLARQFQEEKNEVIIYTFSLQYPSILFPGTSQYSDEDAPKDLVIKVKINSINPVNWLRVGNELKKLKPDLLIVRYWLPFMAPCLGTILRVVKRNHHTKIVCIADNVIPHEKRMGDALFTRYFVKPVDAFVTMSEKVMDDLRQFTKKPAVCTIHPLYDNFGTAINKAEARVYLHLPANEKIVLFFGFIRKYKGLDLLLAAMKILKEKHFDVKLLIAGEFYDDQKKYEELIDTLGIRDLLFLRTAFISDSEVKYYLSAADFVIQPYRHATQSGVTPLAYHFEKPMLVTNVGGLPALVPDGKAGLVAEPDAASVAEKIMLLYGLGEDYFLPRLRAEKKKYSWRHFTEAICQIAASVTGNE